MKLERNQMQTSNNSIDLKSIDDLEFVTDDENQDDEAHVGIPNKAYYLRRKTSL
jgi:hypothetical protein